MARIKLTQKLNALHYGELTGQELLDFGLARVKKYDNVWSKRSKTGTTTDYSLVLYDPEAEDFDGGEWSIGAKAYESRANGGFTEWDYDTLRDAELDDVIAPLWIALNQPYGGKHYPVFYGVDETKVFIEFDSLYSAFSYRGYQSIVDYEEYKEIFGLNDDEVYNHLEAHGAKPVSGKE